MTLKCSEASAVGSIVVGTAKAAHSHQVPSSPVGNLPASAQLSHSKIDSDISNCTIERSGRWFIFSYYLKLV